MNKLQKIALGAAGSLLGLAALVWLLNTREEPDLTAPATATAPNSAMVQRGAYLARAGNCMTCHTARGGASYAGGRGIVTPFGTVYTSNLTPDDATGIGSWSPAHFWRAMHNGRSKDGRLLYPAFPYTNYTQVTREDSDALFAYLKSLTPVAQANQAHAIRFPYQSQAALAVWRALYFSPGTYKPDATRNAAWNRGAYLVNGLGHCSACHTARNALGATDGLNLAGGLIPIQNWYAPSLTSPHEAGVGDWSEQDIVRLLKDGVSPRAAVNGPMTEVVLGSTQYLFPQDLSAMAQFLKSLQTTVAPGARTALTSASDSAVMATSPSAPAGAVPKSVAARGAQLYEQHCAQCHGDNGKGVPNAYPALAGNRAVLMSQTSNLVQVVLNGGYAPATQGNPRPFGMPPFVLVLDDSDIATVLTHVRSSWGNQASVVSPLDVNRIRANQAR
jgi:mono/diheme cytochrome c family protein